MILTHSRASSCIRMDFQIVSCIIMHSRTFSCIVMRTYAFHASWCFFIPSRTLIHSCILMRAFWVCSCASGFAKHWKTQHFENSAPTNKAFARNAHADSRGNMRVGVTVVQSWSESVFPLSLECPLDWREFLGVGVTAAPHPVTFRLMVTWLRLF